MKMCLTLFFIYSCFQLLAIVQGQSNTPPAWSYNYGASNGPTNWYKLPGYEACNGYSQSPIALNQRYSKSFYTPIKFTNYDNYRAKNVTISNNGHTVDVEFTYYDNNLASIPYITGGLLNGKYKLIGFHFHWGSTSSKGSEHTINNKRFPMEGHFVHIKSNFQDLASAGKYKDGIAVVGYMFTISSQDNRYLTSFLNNFQYVQYKDQIKEIYAPDPYLVDILPKTNQQSFYTYRGSLTVPPCTESVVWIVYTSTVQISENQMKYFRKLKETTANDPYSKPLVNNFRELQYINGRPVYFYKYSTYNYYNGYNG